MRLATFTHDARTRIGIVTDDALLDLSELAPELPTDMRAFLAAGDEAMAGGRAALERGSRPSSSEVSRPG